MIENQEKRWAEMAVRSINKFTGRGFTGELAYRNNFEAFSVFKEYITLVEKLIGSLFNICSSMDQAVNVSLKKKSPAG